MKLLRRAWLCQSSVTHTLTHTHTPTTALCAATTTLNTATHFSHSNLQFASLFHSHHYAVSGTEKTFQFIWCLSLSSMTGTHLLRAAKGIGPCVFSKPVVLLLAVVAFTDWVITLSTRLCTRRQAGTVLTWSRTDSTQHLPHCNHFTKQLSHWSQC